MPEYALYDDTGSEFFLPSTVKSEAEDDLSHFLSSIVSSQFDDPNGPNLPHLPAEILLCILEKIPPAYILHFRFVCRAFRDYIDSHIFYSYIAKTRLRYICVEITSPNVIVIGIQGLEEVEATFSHLENADNQDSHSPLSTGRKKPKWDGMYAVFRLDQDWLAKFRGAASSVQGLAADPFAFVSRQLNRQVGTDHCTWIIALDEIFNDTQLPGLQVDLNEGTVRFLWRSVLLLLLKEEREIRMAMEKYNQCQYTYSHTEDCLRAVRRQRLRSYAQEDSKEARNCLWALNNMQSLFTNAEISRYTIAQDTGLMDTENTLMRYIVPRRRQAAMSVQEILALRQYVDNRRALLRNRSRVDQMFYDWRSQAYSIYPPSSCRREWNEDTELLNMLDWTDERRSHEDARMKRWLSNKSNAEELLLLLEAFNFANDLELSPYSSTL